MKYSIIMPYYMRHEQLHNTLISFRYWYKNRNDYEVIIVEDKKNQNNTDLHKALIDTLERFKDINVKLIPNPIESWNPSTHFNLGVKESTGEYIVITNPECFHKTNILNGFDGWFGSNREIYIVCACEKGDNIKVVDKFEDFDYEHRCFVQHSKQRNSLYHWCSCLSRKWYNKLGGFDEDYSNGWGAEDDDWKFCIQHSTLKIHALDDLLVVHQQHPSPKVDNAEGLLRRNRRILKNKWNHKTKAEQRKERLEKSKNERKKKQEQKQEQRTKRIPTDNRDKSKL